MKLLLAKLMYQAQTTVAVKNTLSLALILARVLLKRNLVRTARLGRRRCENFRKKFYWLQKTKSELLKKLQAVGQDESSTTTVSLESANWSPEIAMSETESEDISEEIGDNIKGSDIDWSSFEEESQSTDDGNEEKETHSSNNVQLVFLF